MKQKLALAQAITEDQAGCILDAPFNELGADSVARVQTLLHDPNAAGKTIIFTSHNAADIEPAGTANRNCTIEQVA